MIIALLMACADAPPPAPMANVLGALTLGEFGTSVTDHGAIPDDGLDDADAFHAALDALALLPEPRVLYVPAGAWEIENRENRKRGFLIDVDGLTVRCETGAILRGDETPGDHLDPPQDWSSKDAISVQPPTGALELRDVAIEGCQIVFGRAHVSREQAHAVVLTGTASDDWVRNVSIRGTVIGPVGSGDGIYCGARCEGLTVEDVTVSDPARNGVTVAGNAGTLGVRSGFDVRDLRVHWTGYNVAQEGGPALDFEPNQAHIRIRDVDVHKVRAPRGALNVSHVDGGVLDDIAVNWVQTARLDGTRITGLRMDCRPGTGGDGHGYCLAHFQPPSVFTVEGTMRVHPDGEGLVYARDYRADPSFHDYEQVYGITVQGRTELNGGVLVRPDILSDPLLVHVDVEVVDPAPAPTLAAFVSTATIAAPVTETERDRRRRLRRQARALRRSAEG